MKEQAQVRENHINLFGVLTIHYSSYKLICIDKYKQWGLSWHHDTILTDKKRAKKKEATDIKIDR